MKKACIPRVKRVLPVFNESIAFNVVLIFAVCKLFLHNRENPLNCSAASSTLVGSKLTRQAVQEVVTHTKIIAVRR